MDYRAGGSAFKTLDSLREGGYGLTMGENTGGWLGDIFNRNGVQAGTEYIDKATGDIMREGTFFNSQVLGANQAQNMMPKDTKGLTPVTGKEAGWWEGPVAVVGAVANAYGVADKAKANRAAARDADRKFELASTQYDDAKLYQDKEIARRDANSAAMGSAMANSGLGQLYSRSN
jgi:hypothetical protein